MFTKLASL